MFTNKIIIEVPFTFPIPQLRCAVTALSALCTSLPHRYSGCGSESR